MRRSKEKKSASKNEPGLLRETIRQQDSVVDQLEKEIMSETESENLKTIRDIELEINKETLEKDNNTTRKGPEETEVKE